MGLTITIGKIIMITVRIRITIGIRITVGIRIIGIKLSVGVRITIGIAIIIITRGIATIKININNNSSSNKIGKVYSLEYGTLMLQRCSSDIIT
jgi:hypothetical protein